MAEAPGVGGGKIRSRRSNQARKPYSRAKSQHKSLFSRVTDSVKSLLNPITPNWLTNRFNQKHGVTPMPWAYEQTSNNIDIPSTSDITEEPSASTNNNYKQVKLARPAISTSASSSSLQMYITPPDTPKSEMTPPLSGKQGLLKQLALNKKQQESLRSSLADQQTQPLKLVDAKTFINDDVSIASSSGCSSSIQMSQKTNTPGEDGVGPKNLWSASPSSQSSGKASRPCQQPTMSSSKRPRFNPSVFGVSAMTYPAQKDSLNSTFYNGPIQFGGANATAKVPYFATPYKVPNVTKVKVHHVHQRTPRPKTTSTASSKATLDDTMSSGMSSTARKILQTLEKMSSPLNDARRIPSITRTPSFSADERRSRRTFGGSSLSNTSFKGPPTAGLSTPYAAKVRKRVSMPLNNSLLTRTAQKLDEEQRFRQTVFDAQSIVLIDSRSISTRGVSAPIASLSSSASMPRNSSGSSGGGKMKNMKKSTAHYSASHDELEEEAPDLPAVSLPLTGASNLPSFNFGKSMVTSTPAARNLNKEDNKAPSKPEFNFASPVVKTTRIEQIPTAANTPQFQFSSPTKKSSLSDTETPKTKSSANFTPGDNAGKSSLMFAPDPKVVSSLRTTKQRSSPSSPIDTVETQGGGFKPAAKLKIGSVMDFLGDSSKNTSDKQPMTVTSPKDPAPTLGLLKQIKKGWECDTCLIRNNSDASKCIACETPRPGGGPSGATAPATEKTLFPASLNVPKDSPFSFGIPKKDSRKETGPDSNKDEEVDVTSAKPLSSWGAAFKKPSGNWECGTCLISNDSSKIKCVACETPKPGADTSSKTKTTWGSQFKKPSGNWECATCLLSNDTIKTKCVACETPKPGAKIETQNVLGISVPNKSQFKFGLSDESSSGIAAKSTSNWGSQFKRPAATWECEVCMVVNSDDRRSCQACESPKPGTEKEEKFNKSFKFGKTSPGLVKFTKPEVPEADKTEEKKEDEKSTTKPTVSFGLSQKSDSSAPSKPTYSFGVPTKETTTSKAPQVAVAQSSSDKSDKQKIPSFNFGVPQKSQTEPAEKKKEGDSKPSEVKSFKPQAKFSFGAPDKSKEMQAKEKESAPTFTFSAPPTSSISTGVSSSQITAPSGFTFGKTPAQAPPAFGLSSSEKPKAPVFDSVPSSQSSAPFGSAVTTQSGFGPPSAAVSKPPLYGGFNASKDVKSVEDKPSLPSFSFGNTTSSSSSTGFQFPGTQVAPVSTTSTATLPQSAGFSFGGNSQTPATTSSLFGSGSQPSSNISTKPPGFTGFGIPSSNPPATQASGFSFTSSLQSGPGSVFGTAPPNVAPFGNSSQNQSIFGTSKPNSTQFGNNNPTSDAPTPFGPSSTSGSMFGTPNNSSTNAGLPKPSFAFGANTEQKAPSAFTGFNFNAATPTNNTNPTGGSSGFAFGATPNKPSGAFNPNNNASTPFQFNSPAPQQQQSNGLFKFGGSNVPQSNVTTENNKSGMFVFGGNKPETNSQPVAPVGFNFGAAPSAGPTFNFGGTASVAPQPASNMFSAAPNQNMFNAGPGQSATPGKRVIRQARRKLRK